MEREKQEKKENILKITRQLQEVGKTSYRELEDQGVQLKRTHKDVKQISGHLNKIDRDLGEIQANRKGHGALRNCLSVICCCAYCCGSGRPPPKKTELDAQKSTVSLAVKSDEHLTADRIEKEWCMRYDPEERWIKQVELGLDYLLELAEQMKRSFDEQNRLAEQIYLDVSSNQNRIRTSRQKMKHIQQS